MSDNDRAALLERAAEYAGAAVIRAADTALDCRYGNNSDAAAEWDKICAQSAGDRDALRALAAELRAEPPWIDAPDDADCWEAGAPGQDTVMMDLYRCNNALWATLSSGAVVELARWIADHPDWRYRRRTPVVVPPREATQ